MPRHSYRERDHAFEQVMFKLRTSIGLTQAGLADLLEISRRAVGEWEGGLNYPKAVRLQQLIALCVRQHVFAPEREEEQIRSLWKTAHQRVLLDEAGFSSVLTRPSFPPVSVPLKEAAGAAQLSARPPGNSSATQPAACLSSFGPLARRNPSASGPRVDWVGALDVNRFTGREVELAELSHWMVHEQCRLVAILGMGGIGKSALVSLLGKHLAPQFDAVLWRSVRDAPPAKTWSPIASPSSRKPHPRHSPPRSSSALTSCWHACRRAVACWCSTTWRRSWQAGTPRATTC